MTLSRPWEPCSAVGRRDGRRRWASCGPWRRP